MDRAALRRVLRLVTQGPPRRGISCSRRLALEQAQARCGKWAQSPGVVGFGIGPRVREGCVLGEQVLKVYVERKLKRKECSALVDREILVAGERVAEVDVHPLGRFELHAPLGHERPLRAGLGIGNATVANTGTLGCFVRRRGAGEADPLFLLSCAHVLASRFPTTPPEPILQPSREHYGSELMDHVATLVESAPIWPSPVWNEVDAAIAQLDDKVRAALTAEAGLPAGVATAIKVGARVHGEGARSGKMSGRVVDTDFVLADVHLPTTSGGVLRAGFRRLVLTTRYGRPGDSGATILDEQDLLLGLHMGGFPDGAVFCRMAIALEVLGIDAVTRR